GISHHDVTAGSSRHAPLQSRAVAAPCNWHAVRTEPLCNGLAAVSATVVSDDNLALEAERQSHLVERLVSVRNALRQAMRLIEARHDDRNINLVGRLGRIASAATQGQLPPHDTMTCDPSDERICPLRSEHPQNGAFNDCS